MTMNIQDQFLGYLRSQASERVALSTRLGGDGRVCVYYICPFSALRNIVEEGIKCRNSVPECDDLSSPDVQSRRNTVWLGHSDTAGILHKPRESQIHSCVSLFWNPLNRTFDAFQRNALLRAADKKCAEHGIVCLLELDAERLLNAPAIYWTAVKGNAASNAPRTWNLSILKQFPWSKIFACGTYTEVYPWQVRAAELIVHLGGQGQQHTTPIPPSCFNRVIISPEVQLTEEQERWLSSTGLRYDRANVFASAIRLLDPEKRFIENLAEYWQTDKDCISRFAMAFRMIIEFESHLGGPTEDRFLSRNVAHSAHGIGHTARVMLWSAFLSTYPFGLDRTSDHVAAIVAALTHDLGRQSEGVDEGHGERAMEKHRNLAEIALGEETLRRSSANAVQLHEIADCDCSIERRDHQWELLKDADGLDRGRFAIPGLVERGCNPAMLRFGYLGHAELARTCMPWLAYQLYRITRHCQWNHYPCRDMLRNFFYGLDLGLTHRVFQGRSQTVAERLHQGLSSLLNELAVLGCRAVESGPRSVTPLELNNLLTRLQDARTAATTIREEYTARRDSILEQVRPQLEMLETEFADHSSPPTTNRRDWKRKSDQRFSLPGQAFGMPGYTRYTPAVGSRGIAEVWLDTSSRTPMSVSSAASVNLQSAFGSILRLRLEIATFGLVPDADSAGAIFAAPTAARLRTRFRSSRGSF